VGVVAWVCPEVESMTDDLTGRLAEVLDAIGTYDELQFSDRHRELFDRARAALAAASTPEVAAEGGEGEEIVCSWAERNQEKFYISGGRLEACLTEDELLEFAEFVLATARPAPVSPAAIGDSVPAHVIAKVADALDRHGNRRGGDWFLNDCANALRGHVGADGSQFDPKDCRCLYSGTGRHTFVAPGCELGDFPEPAPPAEDTAASVLVGLVELYEKSLEPNSWAVAEYRYGPRKTEWADDWAEALEAARALVEAAQRRIEGGEHG
jgi:hypothetical protein